MTKFSERYESIKKEEIKELRNALESVGGAVLFSAESEPIITCEFDWVVSNYRITSAEIVDDEIWLHGYDSEDKNVVVNEIHVENVAYGHLQYVTEEVIKARGCEVTFTFTSCITIKGETYEEIRKIWENMQLYSEEALSCGADFGDTIDSIDTHTFEDVTDKLWP